MDIQIFPPNWMAEFRIPYSNLLHTRHYPIQNPTQFSKIDFIITRGHLETGRLSAINNHDMGSSDHLPIHTSVEKRMAPSFLPDVIWGANLHENKMMALQKKIDDIKLETISKENIEQYLRELSTRIKKFKEIDMERCKVNREEAKQKKPRCTV